MWEKELWIASRNYIDDNNGKYDAPIYNAPRFYKMNYQPIEGDVTSAEYGQKKNARYQAFVERRYYQGKIKTGDRVYLSDESILESELRDLALNDNMYCEKANYEVVAVLPQNIKMQIIFKKILDSEGNKYVY